MFFFLFTGLFSFSCEIFFLINLWKGQINVYFKTLFLRESKNWYFYEISSNERREKSLKMLLCKFSFSFTGLKSFAGKYPAITFPGRAEKKNQGVKLMGVEIDFLENFAGFFEFQFKKVDLKFIKNFTKNIFFRISSECPKLKESDQILIEIDLFLIF